MNESYDQGIEIDFEELKDSGLKIKQLGTSGLSLILEELTSYDQDRFERKLTDHIKSVAVNGSTSIIDEARQVYTQMVEADADNMALVMQKYASVKKDMTERLLSVYFDDLFSDTNFEERTIGISRMIEFYASSIAVDFMANKGYELNYDDNKFFQDKLSEVFEKPFDEFVELLGKYVDNQELILIRKKAIVNDLEKEKQQDDYIDLVRDGLNKAIDYQDYIIETHRLLNSI